MGEEKKERECMRWKSWGVQIEDGMRHQESPWNCPFCDHKPDFIRMFLPFIIGFCEDNDYGIFECPECFEKFFIHMGDSTQLLLSHYVKDEPDYLKVPGALDNFLEMLKGRRKTKNKS